MNIRKKMQDCRCIVESCECAARYQTVFIFGREFVEICA